MSQGNSSSLMSFETCRAQTQNAPKNNASTAAQGSPTQPVAQSNPFNRNSVAARLTAMSSSCLAPCGAGMRARRKPADSRLRLEKRIRLTGGRGNQRQKVFWCAWQVRDWRCLSAHASLCHCLQ